MTRVLVSYPYGPNYSFIFPFERRFEVTAAQRWMDQNWHLSIYVGVLYLVFILVSKKAMEGRSPLGLRGVLTVWNVCLAAFSLLGASRTWPELFYVSREYGLHYSLCNNSYKNNRVTAFWGYLFVLSKGIELLDTAFVVARKQKLTMIHWFHHFVTMVICWFIFSEAPAMARYMSFTNYAVHSVMYSYYALKALRVRVSPKIALVITIAQIAQMIGGFVAGVYSAVILSTGGQCDVTVQGLIAILFGYGSFFALFLNFFVRKYLMGDRTKTLVKTRQKVA